MADHYALTSVKPSMLKHQIKNVLIQFFVDEEFSIRLLYFLFSLLTDLQLRELEIQRQIQLEKLRIEKEERIILEQQEGKKQCRNKIEREERIRLEQVEREIRMQ